MTARAIFPIGKGSAGGNGLAHRAGRGRNEAEKGSRFPFAALFLAPDCFFRIDFNPAASRVFEHTLRGEDDAYSPEGGEGVDDIIDDGDGLILKIHPGGETGPGNGFGGSEHVVSIDLGPVVQIV